MQRERRKNNAILFHFRKDGLPMTKLSQLKIDPEFQGQINPPPADEEQQLEQNILEERRLLNPIITWNGYIVDGHTRYRILKKHQFIQFEVIEKDFANRFEVLAYAYSAFPSSLLLYPSPHAHMASRTGFRLYPSSVKVYSTRGGTSA